MCSDFPAAGRCTPIPSLSPPPMRSASTVPPAGCRCCAAMPRPHYAAKSWGDTGRRVVAPIEASTMGLDIRFVITSLKGSSAEHIYDTL